MEMEGIQNEGEGAIPGGSDSQQEDASVPGEMNSDSDMWPYASWAADIAASTRSSSAVDPLPENILHVMDQVFQNGVLLENILEKIILDGDRTSVRSCRLVSKQWVCALAKIYKKLKKPQFIVDTNKEAVLMEPHIRPVFEQHTLLYDFTKPMIRHDRIEGFIPTFSLHLGPTYFRKSSYSDFVNCLVQCGSSLVELYIRFPMNSTMSFLLPPGISLPNLNTFGVSFSNQALLTDHFHTDVYPNHCTIHLVQSLLNVSTNLRRFHFMPCVEPTNPPDMENLYLPETLTSVRIDTPINELEMFLRRNFPCLTELRLNATTMALFSEEERLYELFNKLSRTLRHVWLTGTSRFPHSIRLPRMDNVTKFVIFKPWEFEERSPPTIFGEIFPNLKSLVFANQTEHSFQYLMSGMRSTSVKSFCVWLTSNRRYQRVMENIERARERGDNDDVVQGQGPRNPQLGDPPARRLRPNRARQRMRPGGMILRGEPNQDGNDPWQVAVRRWPHGHQGHLPFRHIQIRAPAARAPLPERPITMTKGKLNCINLAFPNLVKLTINLCGPGTGGLKYIFEEMKSLQSLRVIVETSLRPINWDSVLTGISPEFCEAIKANSQPWDEVYLNENHVSITNMTNLKELFLLECFKLNEQQSTNQVLDARCVSDLAFHFAILKMKNLEHLSVTPGFAPSQAMYRKWHEEKGFPIKTRPKTRLDLNFYESLED